MKEDKHCIELKKTLKEEISEYALKQSILNNIDNFLRQLGFGFTYVVMSIKLR